jgi:hypothetical protein
MANDEENLPRECEEQLQVFRLGHYEQMQLDLAIAKICHPSRFGDVTIDRDTLGSLSPIFAAHGTVTILRDNE